MSTQQSIPKPANAKKKSDILPIPAQSKSHPVVAQPKIESTLSNEEQLAQIRAKREASERLGSTLLTPESVPHTPPPLQPKLTIGQPGDQYEQEADRVARQVVDHINAPPKIQAKAPRHPMQSVGELKPSPLDDHPVMKVQRQATGGEMDASPDLESSIQRARGSGQPLDDGIRERMEGAFGADFSGVRVHTDGTSDQLNQSIQAKAFTTGQDVFFRQGAYNPGSRGGQELLAHELTHVVQQKGGAVQRQSQTKSVQPLQTVGGLTSVQRKLAKVSLKNRFGQAHLRNFENDSGTVTVDENEKIGLPLKHKQIINVEETQKDSTGKWMRADVNSTTGYIRISSVDLHSSKAAAQEAQEKIEKSIHDKLFGDATPYEAESQTPENAAELLEATSKNTENASDEDEGIVTEGSKETNSLGATSGYANTFGGLIQMAQGIKTFLKADATNEDKAEAAFEALEGLTTATSGATNVVDSTAKVHGQNTGNETQAEHGIGESDLASDVTTSIGGAMTAIKTGFFWIKAIYEQVKLARTDVGTSSSEKFKASMDIISRGLETAKSAVETIQGIIKVLGDGVSEAFSAAVPGLSIAISGANLAIKVYDVILATMHRKRMQILRKEFKCSKAGTSYVAPQSRKKGIYGFRTEITTDKVDLTQLENRRRELEGLSSRNDNQEKELQEILEYELATEFKLINNKRLVRAGVHIGLEMTKIAGEIATLSGAGAMAGTPIKMAASGAKVSMSVARKLKQYGRDRAEKPTAWNITKTVFNTEKSTAKKYEKRGKHANLILKMIAKLPAWSNNEAVNASYLKVENFIKASGCDPKALYRLNGITPLEMQIKKQRELLMESMTKRE